MPSEQTEVLQPEKHLQQTSKCPLVQSRDFYSLINRELLDYLASLVDKRLEEPKDDLISKLCTEQVKPGNIEKADAVQIAFLLLVAGNATMVNMIALVRLALQHCICIQLLTITRVLLPCSNIRSNWRS